MLVNKVISLWLTLGNGEDMEAVILYIYI